MNALRTCVAGAVVAAVALPTTAEAKGHHGRDGFDASSRTEKRVKRTLRLLDRAVDAIDDGDQATAVARLSGVDKHLDRAIRSAVARADKDNGPGSLGLAARAADKVAVETGDALDGAVADLDDALAGSLDNALDGRDEIVAVTTDADVLDRIAEDSDDEAEGFAEGLAEDELSATGEAALTAGATQAAATADAAEAKAGTGTVADDDEDGDDRGDCPKGPGGGGPTGASGPQGNPRPRV